MGLALRKEALRLRGAIATSRIRPPTPTRDEMTGRGLGGLLARLGLPGR
jgi:hypothetical protein